MSFQGLLINAMIKVLSKDKILAEAYASKFLTGIGIPLSGNRIMGIGGALSLFLLLKTVTRRGFLIAI